MLGWLSFGLACVAVGIAVYSLYASYRTEHKRRAMQKLVSKHEQAVEASRRADEAAKEAQRQLPDGDD